MAALPTDCICGTEKEPFCTEDIADSTCPWCKTTDIYDPCPNQGWGCGKNCDDTDCCTPEQRENVEAAHRRILTSHPEKSGATMTPNQPTN